MCRYFDDKPELLKLGYDPPCYFDWYDAWWQKRERRFMLKLFGIPVAILAVIVLVGTLLSGCSLIECLTDWEHGCPD